MIQKKILSITFAIDNGYTNQLKVVLYSLLKHKEPSTIYHIYLLAYQFLPENVGVLEQIVRDNDLSGLCKFTYLSISQEDEENLPLFKNVNHGNGWGRETLYRLLIPKYLPTPINRVLYLDADILIQDDLCSLLDINLSRKALAGVIDPAYFHIYGELAMHNYRLAKLEGLSDEKYQTYFSHYRYINAGILLFNVDYWRENQLDKQMIELLRRIYDEGEQYLPIPNHPFVSSVDPIDWPQRLYPDQDVINYLVFRRNLDEIVYLPMNYNISTTYYNRTAELIASNWTAIEWLRIIHCNMPVRDKGLIDEKSKIWHFTGTSKPWNDTKHSFASLYQSYAKQIGWSIHYPLDRFKTKQIKKIVKMLIPYGLVRLIQKNK